MQIEVVQASVLQVASGSGTSIMLSINGFELSDLPQSTILHIQNKKEFSVSELLEILSSEAPPQQSNEIDNVTQVILYTLDGASQEDFRLLPQVALKLIVDAIASKYTDASTMIKIR